jgi:hypothetical protein
MTGCRVFLEYPVPQKENEGRDATDLRVWRIHGV